jgi:hypothetical protein
MRLALAAVSALVLVAAGCGGVESEPTLAQAVERTEDEPSFAFEVRARGTQADETLDFECSGVVDNKERRAWIECDGAEGYDRITIGRASFFRFSGGETWTRSEVVEPDEPMFSPTRILELLRNASRETRRVGEGDVRGESTVRYTLTVDCEQAELDCDRQTEVGVWIGEDGLVRRIDVVDSGMEGTVEFFDFGEPVVVEAPPPEDVREAPTLPKLEPCSEQTADPIGVQQAIDALGRNGFGMERSPVPLCGPGIAAMLQTSGPPNPAEGINCEVFVQASAIAAVEPIHPTVTRRFENLVCRLFVDKGDESVARLDAAFAELKRELGP